jgi:AcrR family transcriptional regulator
MRKNREQRREEIIEATLELAAERGARDASTQAIADRVGIAQATVFRHFRTRDEIFAGALEWIGRALFLAIKGTLEGSGSPAHRLRKLIRLQLKFISGRKGIPRLLLSDRLHLENPALKRTVLGIMARYTAEVSRLMRDGMERGEFRSDLDPERAAEMLIAMIQGLVVRWSLSDFSFRLEDAADDVWSILWPALRRTEHAE